MMDEARLTALLESVSAGHLSAADALDQLRLLPFEKVGNFAHIDTHRDLRTGFPEVVFCAGKTDDQIRGILDAMLQRQRCILATRMNPATAEKLLAGGVDGTWHEAARCFVIEPVERPEPLGQVVICCAGTSDLPVAEEAAITAETMGSRIERIYDVGVAGIHRLLGYAKPLLQANAIVVVAGMEGALPSVVGGLVSAPVIAVPTSIGYGAAFQGVAPLLTMLNACSANVVVVNIDSGFKGGYVAALIARRAQVPRERPTHAASGHEPRTE